MFWKSPAQENDYIHLGERGFALVGSGKGDEYEQSDEWVESKERVDMFDKWGAEGSFLGPLSGAELASTPWHLR